MNDTQATPLDITDDHGLVDEPSLTVAAAERIDHHPIAALIGGVALGALLGAVFPVTQKERQKLGPLGRKVTDKAREAAHVATERGKAKLDELGFNRDNAKAQADRFVAGIKDVAAAARKTVSKDVEDTPS